MSSHCSKYPTCECPEEVGRYCQAEWSMEDIIKRNQADKQAQANLTEAFEKLSDSDKIAYKRGYKTFKTNGKCEFILVDNIPPSLRGGRGTNFTPPKKKRNKRTRR